MNAPQDLKPTTFNDVQLQELAAVKAHGGKDTHISADETPWFNWVGDIDVKILRIDNRTGTFVLGLRAPTDQWLGRHRHRGIVTATTIAGAWNYREYAWVARPGDYVVETPGTIHTLHISANTEIVYTVTGSIEFFNDDDSLSSVWDGFSFVNHYAQHCARTGQEVNPRLFY